MLETGPRYQNACSEWICRVTQLFCFRSVKGLNFSGTEKGRLDKLAQGHYAMC